MQPIQLPPDMAAQRERRRSGEGDRWAIRVALIVLLAILGIALLLGLVFLGDDDQQSDQTPIATTTYSVELG